MRTDDLITLLASDARVRVRFGRFFAIAVTIGIAASALFLILTLGIRKDMGEMIGTPRVLFKIGTTFLLAVLATRLAFRIGRPGVPLRQAVIGLALPLVVLIAGMLAELVMVPRDEWLKSMTGHYSVFCMIFVPILSLAPLAAILYAVKQGAPRSPGLAGAASGLAAGGIAAAIYSWHCPDDSPLFLAVWYSVGILFAVVMGFLIGRKVLRW